MYNNLFFKYAQTDKTTIKNHVKTRTKQEQNERISSNRRAQQVSPKVHSLLKQKPFFFTLTLISNLNRRIRDRSPKTSRAPPFLKTVLLIWSFFKTEIFGTCFRNKTTVLSSMLPISLSKKRPYGTVLTGSLLKKRPYARETLGSQICSPVVSVPLKVIILWLPIFKCVHNCTLKCSLGCAFCTWQFSSSSSLNRALKKIPD